jgi:hypothetical protein
MTAIESTADHYSAINTEKGYTTLVVKGIPIDKVFCNFHRTSQDVALAYNQLEPRLGDRVVNLSSPGVPFGLRGTVITIHSATKYVEVRSLTLSSFLSFLISIFLHFCCFFSCLLLHFFVFRLFSMKSLLVENRFMVHVHNFVENYVCGQIFY